MTDKPIGQNSSSLSGGSITSRTSQSEYKKAVRIAILGGGFSGAATAIHLSRLSPIQLEILIVEPSVELGRGLAYGSEDPDHRLNAAAASHTIYPEDPSHFADWLKSSGVLDRDPEAEISDGRVFPRRSDFGRYMVEQLDEHRGLNPSASSISHVVARAVSVVRSGQGFTVTLDNGTTLAVQACVLALTGGKPAQTLGRAGALPTHPSVIANPWDVERLKSVPAHARVLLVGTALTCADVIATLIGRAHSGPLVAISRHGRRPGTQCPLPTIARPSLWARLAASPPPFALTPETPTALGLLRAARRHVATHLATSGTVCSAIEDIRASSHLAWRRLPPREQRRFLRRMNSVYDTQRFRVAPQTGRIADDAVARGQLRFVHGRIKRIDCNHDAVSVIISHEPPDKSSTLEFDVVINCTGLDDALMKTEMPVLHGLFTDGLVDAAENGIGMAVDQTSCVIDRAGQRVSGLHAVGPLTRGTWGEATGVPFIVRHILEMIPALLNVLPAVPNVRS